LPDAQPRSSHSGPDREEALGRTLGERRRRYSSTINARLRVTGHLLQARFGSVAMDEERLMTAARYVALNPVREPLPQTGGRLALVERRRASGGARRRPRERRARSTTFAPAASTRRRTGDSQGARKTRG